MYKFVFCFGVMSFFALSNLQAMENLDKKKEMIIGELKNIQGWCSPEKASAMFDLIMEQKPDVCVEVGAYGGSSIFPTAMALKFNQKGTIYAIDAWDNQECVKHTNKDDAANYKWWSTIDFKEIYRGFIKMLTQFNLTSHTKVLKMNSEKAVEKVPMGIDILHIDGDHSEEASYFDATHYFSKVKIGGYIWFDDALWVDALTKYPTTKKAVEFLKQHCEEVKSVDKGNCILFKKVKEAV